MSDFLTRVRNLCSDFPEVNERISHGHPTFFIRNKRGLAMYRPEEPVCALWCPSSQDNRERRLAAHPGATYVPPYMGPLGWIGLYLQEGTDWELVRHVLEDAYIHVAPTKLAAFFKQNQEGR
jgi:hypothetical protein